MWEIRESQILIVSHDNKEEEFEPIPPFLLDMQLVTTRQALETKAFIDLGADCNVLCPMTHGNLWVNVLLNFPK